MTPDQQSPASQANWIQAALAGIGVATIVTDARGHVLFMNPVAESLTGWPQGEAAGPTPRDRLPDRERATRRPVADPVAEVLATGVGRRPGRPHRPHRPGRDGVADRRRGRPDPGRRRRPSSGPCWSSATSASASGPSRGSRRRRAFAEGIVETVREPLVVLDADLRVRTANRSFYQTFGVTPGQTEGRLLFELGNRQWDIPRLRELLEEILPRDSHFNDFEVDHEFEGIGRRSMVLNARRLPPAGGRPGLILLAIEDATERRRAAEALALSEVRYRRLFETAQDGILLVDPDTRRVFDANPFLTDLLGYTRDELVGKELWEIGLFRDIESNKAAFRTLQEKGYIRYEDLPLRTQDGRGIEVEFVSNVYDVGDTRVIQCNIRDVTDRKRAEDALRAAHAGWRRGCRSGRPNWPTRTER